jgi:pimeloyl-ACP methyl ester carboxylesterase
MSEYININGFKIAYKAWGQGHIEPPIIALHGWLDNANSFAPIAPYLNQYKLIAIDLPGHGHSAHLSVNQPYHFIDGIFILNDIIDALGYEKVHLLGHSMGACLASLVTASIPDKIARMGLIEGLGPLSRTESECVQQIQTHLRYHTLLKTKLNKPYTSLEKAALARTKNRHIRLEDARILAKRGTIKKQDKYYWRHDIKLLSPSPLRLSEPQVLTFLKAIEAPTCLIWSSQGFKFDKQQMRKRVDAVPQLLQHKFKGGHHIHMEEPALVGEVLAQFFDYEQLE